MSCVILINSPHPVITNFPLLDQAVSTPNPFPFYDDENTVCVEN